MQGTPSAKTNSAQLFNVHAVMFFSSGVQVSDEWQELKSVPGPLISIDLTIVRHNTSCTTVKHSVSNKNATERKFSS